MKNLTRAMRNAEQTKPDRETQHETQLIYLSPPGRLLPTIFLASCISGHLIEFINLFTFNFLTHKGPFAKLNEPIRKILQNFESL